MLLIKKHMGIVYKFKKSIKPFKHNRILLPAILKIQYDIFTL